ncbi:Fur family transcriptional regulator [Acetonema longum]|uniref:Ferric uptake regulator, fur family protein n=1 Tax=Acetonema longum DSM 6540 TaxID=1009370 RepID=F7NDL4_9FIRM|nr:Fur family transcriptional regulator [Acetonema longum]EGO65876.1 ferric uptake regulator, fur family protein [Acetonema longum DSM 6540]
MEEIIALLRQKNCKITPQRRAVIQALSDSDQFPTAQAILEYVRKIHPDMGLDTVYRNLNLLVSLGVVNQISVPGRDGNVFELVAHPHHHHLICLKCGKAKCLSYCPVNQEELSRVTGQEEFEVVGHSLEFYGYCQQCRGDR